jgi:DNA/RNA-binding domain of Phe-tRNA-synthetase-like protein
MESLPFTVRFELDGWRLFWAQLDASHADEDGLARACEAAAAEARDRFADTAAISSDPTVAALRRLFRAAGCDPTRYRPSSEALLRRLVKGDAVPRIQPLVDVNNALTARLAVPCCVMVEGSFGNEMVLRSGGEGEAYESLRGPFSIAGKPVLCDAEGPLDTPITGNVRVKVQPETTRAWLVAYMPAETLTTEDAAAALTTVLDGTAIGATLHASP